MLLNQNEAKNDMHVINSLDNVFSGLLIFTWPTWLLESDNSTDPLEKKFNLCAHQGPYPMHVGLLHRVEEEE